MDETREERMRSRMRGAARHQVQNADFGDLFAIPLAAPEPEPEQESESSSDPPAAPSADPEPEPEPIPEPVQEPVQETVQETVSEPVPEPEPEPEPTPAESVKRTNPNTSAKRRRLDAAGTAAPSPAQSSSSANRSSRRLPRAPVSRDPYDLENAPPDEPGRAPNSTPRSRPSTQRAAAAKARSAGPSSAPQSQEPPQSSPLRVEEVGESPADAPGSGHRRRVRASDAADSSARLQSAFRSVDGGTSPVFPQSSSPLSRKSIKSAGRVLASAKSPQTGLRRSTRLSGSPDQGVDELSSDLPVVAEEVGDVDISVEDPAAGESVLEVAETVIDEPTADAEAEDNQAQQIDDREAAQRLGRKRTSRRQVATSPELSPDDASEVLVAKRPRKAFPLKMKSPTKQKQPKAPRPKQSKPAGERKRKSDNEAGPPIPVKIQRFTKLRRRRDDGSDDEDILNSNIPHTSRTGVNAVDFLAHTCERIIGTSVNKIQEAIMNSQDAAAKKELRVKLRALEAFQQELRTRLLEHTIAIDTLFALKKRVREAQREKLKLRDRIIQIRAEREQVALRMDAVRIKHDKESREALHNINLSTAMHDVDLAIEQGLAGPELTAKDQKTADLANLELLISRVTEQACSSGPTGGTLKQIKSFNAFLERAAAVL